MRPQIINDCLNKSTVYVLIYCILIEMADAWSVHIYTHTYAS